MRLSFYLEHVRQFVDLLATYIIKMSNSEANFPQETIDQTVSTLPSEYNLY